MNNITNTCSTPLEKLSCTEIGGKCEIILDGFHIEILISIIYGIIWLKLIKSVIIMLQTFSREDWYILSKKEQEENYELETIIK